MVMVTVFLPFCEKRLAKFFSSISFYTSNDATGRYHTVSYSSGTTLECAPNIHNTELEIFGIAGVRTRSPACNESVLRTRPRWLLKKYTIFREDISTIEFNILT